MLEATDRNFEFGVFVSVLGHAVIAFLIFFEFLGNSSQLGPPTIYSVTMEGGKSLGGMSQVPDENKKTALAPAKNVQAAPEKSKPEEVESVKEKEEPKKEEPVVKPEDAEVSTNIKKEEPKKPEKKPKEVTKKTPEKPVEKKVETKAKEKPIVKDNKDDDNKKLQQAMQRYLGESADAGGKGFGAAAVGGSGMGGGTLMPEIGLRYKKIVEDRTKSGWRWFDTSKEIFAQVTFDISRDGVLSNVRITKSSGNSEFDDSVERAVIKASPLPAPPPEVYEKWFKSVRLTFDPRNP